MGADDSDPLQLAAKGDRAALKVLLAEHGPAVRAKIAAKIPAQWQAVLTADDLMQQTYTDAFLNIERFTPKGRRSFSAWLAKIAQHNLIDSVRMLEADKRGRKTSRAQPANPEESFAELHEILSSGGTSPSRHAARGEARAALEQAIEQLPADYRRAVQMFDLEGRPAPEVAAALSRSVGAAYMIRARAHRRLSEFMGNASDYFSAA